MTAERADLARLRAVGEAARMPRLSSCCFNVGKPECQCRPMVTVDVGEWDGLLDEIERLRGVVAGIEALVEEMEAEPCRANSYPGFNQGYDMRREEDAERLRDLLAAHGPHSDAAGAATGRTDALSDLIAECERDELWLVQQFDDGSQRGRRAAGVLREVMGQREGSAGVVGDD